MKPYQVIFIFEFLYLITSKTATNTLDTDKIYLAVGRDIFPVNLIQNEITEELITILPLKTKILNGTTNENSRHISLRTQIDISIPFISSSINAQRGDLILYKGQELILLNEPHLFNNINENDYIKIGEIDNADKLFNNISMNKSILMWNSLNYENQKEKVKPYGYYTSLMNFFTWKIFTFICFILL
jgi:hypothetical protein